MATHLSVTGKAVDYRPEHCPELYLQLSVCSMGWLCSPEKSRFGHRATNQLSPPAPFLASKLQPLERHSTYHQRGEKRLHWSLKSLLAACYTWHTTAYFHGNTWHTVDPLACFGLHHKMWLGNARHHLTRRLTHFPRVRWSQVSHTCFPFFMTRPAS